MNTIRRGPGTAPLQISVDGEGGRRWLPLWAAGMIAAIALATLLPAKTSHAADDAGATVHEITWLHASPAEVQSFLIFVSPVVGALAGARQIDVGKPGGSDSESPQVFSALVPVGFDEFVAVAAIGQDGLRSALSEWGQPQPSQPGQPLVVEP